VRRVPELNFKGKEFVYNHHLTVPFRPLLPQADKGIGAPALDGNLIIHGDNLHGLKALLPTHAGQVDCIFIDPPYNTGNSDWSYNDNVNSPMIKKWLDDNPVGEDDTLRHDKWMSMMWPRVRLLHELLADGGTLWATIDQIELHRFRSLLEEIFGIDNSIGIISWEKTYTPKSNSRIVSEDTDYVLGFAKGKAHFEADGWNLIDKDETQLARYTNPDGDPKGPWRTFPLDVRTENEGKREKYRYSVVLPSGREVRPAAGRHWSLPKEVFEVERSAGRIYFGVDGDAKPNVKAYLNDGRDKVIARTWWPYKDVGGNQDAKKQLLQIMGDDCDFITPKPETLIRRILDVATHPQSIILDSFAGSGTTAHAVLKANEKDGGKRRFILVEGEDYADRLTAERVRRVINGYDFIGTNREELMREQITFTKLKNANTMLEKVQQIETLDGPKFDRITTKVKDGALIVTGERDCKKTAPGLGGSFTYCELGAPIDMDGLLTGADLPDAAAMAALLYHTATAQAFDPASLLSEPAIGEGVMQLGVANGRTLWLIYKPDLNWLKSSEAALTLSRARAIAAHNLGEHLVFAPAKFVSRELLAAEKLPVEFAPLPFALYRVETA
jgi:adenine-specific DNA-methyltransferase